MRDDTKPAVVPDDPPGDWDPPGYDGPVADDPGPVESVHGPKVGV